MLTTQCGSYCAKQLETALQITAAKGSLVCSRLILEAAYGMGGRDNKGEAYGHRTTLQTACSPTLTMHAFATGMTALMKAAVGNYHDVCNLLIESKANVNMKVRSFLGVALSQCHFFVSALTSGACSKV